MAEEAQKENIDPEWNEEVVQAPASLSQELLIIDPSDQEKAELVALYRGIIDARDRVTNLAIQAKHACDLRDQMIGETVSRSQLFEQKYRSIGKARAVDFDDPKNGNWQLDLETMSFRKVQ